MENEQTAMPIVAGVLSMVNAVLGFFCLFGLIIAISVFPVQSHTFPPGMWGGNINAPLWILWGIAVPCLIVSILSMVGGVYAVLRRNWGVALAGSIAALIPSFILGIPAVILIALSKNEFK